MRKFGDHVMRIMIPLGIGTFIVFPIIWIIVVSVQPGDVAYTGGFELIPQEITFRAYTKALIENDRHIREALIYSFGISSISTLVAMLIALCAVYLIRVDRISARWKKGILQFSVGLYFVPALFVFYGLQMLSQMYRGFQQPKLQLFLIDTMMGYVIALILLLIVYASSQRSYLEQLLLETGSRTRAFFYGMVAPQATGTMVVGGITFATIWSEFFLANLITGAEEAKPFSVILQMAQGQYNTEYSVFAAGAVVSLLVCIFFFSILLSIGLSLVYSQYK